MTAPGVAAMVSPTLNGVRSTIDGMPWLWSMSSAMLAIPRPTLTPPVSNMRLSAAGLVMKELVGAMASRTKASAKRARSRFRPSMPRLSMKGSTLDP